MLGLTRSRCFKACPVESYKWNFYSDAQHESRYEGYHQNSQVDHHKIKFCVVQIRSSHANVVKLEEFRVNNIGTKTQSAKRHKSFPRKEFVYNS